MAGKNHYMPITIIAFNLISSKRLYIYECHRCLAGRQIDCVVMRVCVASRSPAPSTRTYVPQSCWSCLNISRKHIIYLDRQSRAYAQYLSHFHFLFFHFYWHFFDFRFIRRIDANVCAILFGVFVFIVCYQIYNIIVHKIFP